MFPNGELADRPPLAGLPSLPNPQGHRVVVGQDDRDGGPVGVFHEPSKKLRQDIAFGELPKLLTIVGRLDAHAAREVGDADVRPHVELHQPEIPLAIELHLYPLGAVLLAT